MKLIACSHFAGLPANTYAAATMGNVQMLEDADFRNKFDAMMAWRSQPFAGDRGADARELQENQPSLWEAIYNAILPNFTATHVETSITTLFSLINEYVMKYPGRIARAEKGLVFDSTIPILLSADIEAILPSLRSNAWYVATALVNTLAYPLWNDFAKPEHGIQLEHLLRDPRFSSASVQYAIEREVRRRVIADASDIERRKQEFEGVIEASRAEMLLLSDQFRERIGYATGAYGASEKELTKFRLDIEGQVKAFFEESSASVEAIRKQTIENKVFETATGLWRSKATSHGWNFALGLLLMFSIVGSAIGGGLAFGKGFLEALPKKADGEVAYVAAALIVVSIIGVGWLLRFVGRFVTENLVMQTDSLQRRVMLETYIALVGDPNAKMLETDRSLILNAIFRPLPGHQADDPLPPTIAELVKNAATGGKS